MLATSEKNPPLNSQKKVEIFSNPIIDILNNQTQTKDLFTQAIKIIDNSGIDINDKQYIKSKGITESLITEFNKKDESV